MAPPLSKIPAGNLFDACLMAATVEGCIEELLDDIYSRDIVSAAPQPSYWVFVMSEKQSHKARPYLELRICLLP